MNRVCENFLMVFLFWFPISFRNTYHYTQLHSIHKELLAAQLLKPTVFDFAMKEQFNVRFHFAISIAFKLSEGMGW